MRKMNVFVFSRETSNKNHEQALHFDSFLLFTRSDTGAVIIPSKPPSSLQYLYPFRTIELLVVFVYGDDFTRKMNILSIPKSVQIISGLIVFFMSSSAIFLSIIRKKWNFRRSSLVSSIMDTLIAFIGGGNLEMRHIFERWFFAILLFGAFFITSIFAGDLLDCVYQILHQKISTFEQLAATNSSIYINPTLSMFNNDIHDMFRLV